MPRSSSSRSDKPRTSRLTNQLVRAATAWFTSESRYEENHWELELEAVITSLLSKSRDRDIEHALEILTTSNPDAGSLVLELAQHLTEFIHINHDNQSQDCLLMSAPILAWTRYSVPMVNLKPEALEQLVQGLKQFILAPGVNVHCIPKLLSPIEMPLSYPQIRQLLRSLTDASIKGKRVNPAINEFPQGLTLLADPRHLVFVASTAHGEPILKWLSDTNVTREECLKRWKEHTYALFLELFTGCQIEVLLPNSYHSSNDKADRQIRAVGIKASLDWMQTALNLSMGDLQATIMAFGHEQVNEYRIGYSLNGETDVLYGTVWPVFGFDEDLDHKINEITDLEEISAVLKSSDVSDVQFIPELAPLEYCSDCSAPLFPNRQGEVIHAEMPEEALDAPHHFH